MEKEKTTLKIKGVFQDRESIEERDATIQFFKESLVEDKNVTNIIFVDKYNCPMYALTIENGTLTDLELSEIFKDIFALGASGLIIIDENHEEEIRPAIEQLEAAERIKDVGELLGIKMLDYLSVGEDDRYFSLVEDKVKEKNFNEEFTVDEYQMTLDGTIEDVKTKEMGELGHKSKYLKLNERLSETLDGLKEADAWDRFLGLAGHNFNLSFENQVLLYTKKPNAKAVLPLKKWNKIYNRWNNKGTEGAALFTYNSQGNKTKKIEYYFDIEETHENEYRETKEVPVWELDEANELDVLEALGYDFEADELNELTNTEKIISVLSERVSEAVDDEELVFEHNGEELNTFIKDSINILLCKRLDLDSNASINSELLKNMTGQDLLKSGNAINEISKVILSDIKNTILEADESKKLKQQKQIDWYEQRLEKVEKQYSGDFRKEGYIESAKQDLENAKALADGIDKEIQMLYKVLGRIKIEDVTLERNSRGLIVATDDFNNKWVGAEWYSFLANEAFVINEDGTVDLIDDELLDEFKQFASHYEVELASSINEKIDTEVKTLDDTLAEQEETEKEEFLTEEEIASMNFFKEDEEDNGEILITKEMLETVPKLYEQGGIDALDKTCYAAYFVPSRNWTWYLTEYDAESGEAFGLVGGLETEWGYFNINELKKAGAVRITIQDYPKKFSEMEYELKRNFEDYELLKVFDTTFNKENELENETDKELSILDQAKKLINEYCLEEFEQEADFSNLESIGLAYTTDPDTGKEIQVILNLKWCRIEKYYDGELIEDIEYKDIEELIEKRLKNLDFSELTYMSDEQLAVYRAVYKEAVQDEEPEVYEITDDVVTEVLRQGSNVEGGKIRIYKKIKGKAPLREVVEFLKNEYGIGGRSSNGLSVSFNAKGIRIERTDQKIEVGKNLSWVEVANLLAFEVVNDTYLTEEEYKRYLESLIDDVMQETSETEAEPMQDASLPFKEGDTFLLDEKEVTVETITDDFIEVCTGKIEMGGVVISQTIETFTRKDGDSLDRPWTVLVNAFNESKKLDTVTVNLYGKQRVYETREEAMEFFLNAMASSEGSEQGRYSDIYTQLASGLTECTDGEPLLSKEDESTLEPLPKTEDQRATKKLNFNLREYNDEYGGKKERFKRNIKAIKIIKACQSENRMATAEEQQVLAGYVGWGGIPEAFDKDNDSWASEYKELKELLSESEWYTGKESTLTAFYTPKVVTKSIYKALSNMGFKKGNILEPSCGTGNFIGMLPPHMSGSKVYGVELDEISAEISKQLYQSANIMQGGFEKTELEDDFFDVAIGNVPFGDFSVSDPRYNKHNFLIHDYFFAKTIDKVRKGGIIALVTSKGTLDKENSRVREYISQRAEFLGAIRLPNNAFSGNAGTEVVSDIIFLKKRDNLVFDVKEDWLELDYKKLPNDGTYYRERLDYHLGQYNKYFITHPEMVLGEMERIGSRYGTSQTCKPYEDKDLGELLEGAINNISGKIGSTISKFDEETIDDEEILDATEGIKNFSFTEIDGTIYFRKNSKLYPQKELTSKNKERILGQIKIRDKVREILDIQLVDEDNERLTKAQAELSSIYDEFVKKNGRLNSRANISAFAEDNSAPLLLSLETKDSNGEVIGKSDIFSKRTINPKVVIDSCDTSEDALALSLSEKGKVDMPYMEYLTGKTESEIYSELAGVIFLNPESLLNPSRGYRRYIAADEYLSGNIRDKISIAREADEIQKNRPFWNEYEADVMGLNIAALERVMPEKLKASDISVRLGSSWIPENYIHQFICDLMEVEGRARENITVTYTPLTGDWKVDGYYTYSINARTVYGTSRINAYDIIERTLNQQIIRVTDTVEEDGKKKSVLNEKETTFAQDRQDKIKQAFKEWIWADADRRRNLEDIYNTKFNSERAREFDGSHLKFYGMNPEIKLREHQRNAIARVLYGGNTLLAHVVGAGKTFSMVAAAQESKRLGLCNKSLFVVPNHLTEQWASEYLTLYPAANILVATKKDFEKKNRKEFCSRIATGNYDAVIIGHSQFERIPMSLERQELFYREQLADIEVAIEEYSQHGRWRTAIKQSIKSLEKTKKRIQRNLEKLNNNEIKDDVVTFEELGIDKLFIDESHYYKNLYFYTKMSNIAGIPQTESQKSQDLFMKCRYLDEKTSGKGIVFATGTPVSNSMAELYTVQRYLQYDMLKRNGLLHFDAWASTFGETIAALELAPEGTGYRMKTRFAKFFNLPELMTMFKHSADIQTAEMLDLPVPKANFHTVAAKISDSQKEIMESLSMRADKVRDRKVSPKIDNMLCITNDGRKAALDSRLIAETTGDFEGSKVNLCIDNIYRIWESTKEGKGTQLVFSDLSTPKNNEDFSVYNDIKKKLIERGVPESEIEFIHNANTEKQKDLLFAKVREGKVRVLLGSTQKMGAGTNVQNKLIALHDLDCPWRPSDLEQRLGRIVRQGNTNEEVEIFRYVTEGTFDGYLYQTVENKQKFISQLMSGKSLARTAEDIDDKALDYAEIKMCCADNPFIKERMDLEIKVQRLQSLKASYLSNKYTLEDNIASSYPVRIENLEKLVANCKKDLVIAKANPLPADEERFVGLTMFDKHYTDRKEAGEAIADACARVHGINQKIIGEYRGFKINIVFDVTQKEHQMFLVGNHKHQVSLGVLGSRNLKKIDAVIDGLETKIAEKEILLENTKEQLVLAKKEVVKPFDKEEELTDAKTRLEELIKLMDSITEENIDDGETKLALSDDEDVVLQLIDDEEKEIGELDEELQTHLYETFNLLYDDDMSISMVDEYGNKGIWITGEGEVMQPLRLPIHRKVLDMPSRGDVDVLLHEVIACYKLELKNEWDIYAPENGLINREDLGYVLNTMNTTFSYGSGKHKLEAATEGILQDFKTTMEKETEKIIKKSREDFEL